MKIGIIGAGKVGFTLGKYLSIKDVHITGYYSRNAEHALEAAQFTGTTYFENMRELVDASDTLFITTSDVAIGEVWDRIVEYPLENKTICHFSGSLSCDVFSKYEQKGVQVCSVHPFFAFSNKYSAYQQFHKVRFTMEGDALAVEKMKSYWEELGHKVRIIRKEDKAKYHAGMSMASNHVLALLECSVQLLRDCGFEDKEAYQSLETLVCENAANGMKHGVTEALTGPIERNDISTVEKHLSVLPKEEDSIYRNLGKKLVEISKRKNPDRDYKTMEKLLED